MLHLFQRICTFFLKIVHILGIKKHHRRGDALFVVLGVGGYLRLPIRLWACACSEPKEWNDGEDQYVFHVPLSFIIFLDVQPLAFSVLRPVDVSLLDGIVKPIAPFPDAVRAFASSKSF